MARNLKDLPETELHPCEIAGYKFIVWHQKYAQWQFFDVTNTPDGEYAGIICNGGSGRLKESTKIAFFGRRLPEKRIGQENP